MARARCMRKPTVPTKSLTSERIAAASRRLVVPRRAAMPLLWMTIALRAQRIAEKDQRRRPRQASHDNLEREPNRGDPVARVFPRSAHQAGERARQQPLRKIAKIRCR